MASDCIRNESVSNDMVEASHLRVEFMSYRPFRMVRRPVSCRAQGAPEKRGIKYVWIMIAGPYNTGAKNDADREANLLALNQAAYQVFRKGHVPPPDQPNERNTSMAAVGIRVGGIHRDAPWTTIPEDQRLVDIEDDGATVGQHCSSNSKEGKTKLFDQGRR